MKNHHKIKLIAASVALMASFGASAGLGGLNVQSRLGEPFSGSITVTGDEAKALLEGGKASVSNSGLRASVRKSGDKTVLNIRSSRPIQDPVLIFQVGVGAQSREYTAIIDPAGYNGQTDGSTRRQPRAVAAEAAAGAPSRKETRTRAANSAPARQAAVERKAAKSVNKSPALQNETRLAYGRSHLVRQGETLTGIASRIRPQGMTLAQTLQALVNANPDVFVGNDADKMLAGKVLNIPPRAQLQQLAAQTPAVKVPSENTASAKSASEAAVASASEAQNAVAEQQTSASAQTDKAGAASAGAVSAPSASDTAASAAASQPSAAPVPKPNQEQAPVQESEDSGLWRWLLLGGAALIAAYLLSRFFGRHKQTSATETEEIFPDPVVGSVEKEDSVFDEPLSDGSQSVFRDNAAVDSSLKSSTAVGSAIAGSAAAKYKAAADELEMEDDFGDDIFFTDADDTPPVKRGDVNVDLNSLDNTQSGILSGAVTRDAETEKRREADWDKIESTESVYEPDPEPYDFTASPTTASAAHNEQPDALRSTSVETLESVSSDASTDMQSEKKSTEEEAWDFFADDPQKSGDTVKLASSDEVQEVSSVAQPAYSEEVPLEFSLGKDNASAVVEAEIPAETGVFEIGEKDSLSFQDGQDLSADTPAVAQIDEAETIEWADIAVDDIAESRREAGFISEAVGMTAPLEAKYELAKMYVEIGDPEAAKETLQQLLEEADGAILAKAKAMLKDLDA